MKIHYLLPLAVTCLFIGCEAEKDVRTFDELRFASMMAGGDNDEGGTNITLTTCHVAGPLETSVIFEVKSVPVIRYGSLDCKVIDEFAAPVTEVNVSLLATISGEQLPATLRLVSFSDVPTYYFKPGDTVLGVLRKSGDTWFLNSAHWVYDELHPLRNGFSDDGNTYTYDMPTTFDELVADAEDVRSNFVNRCTGQTDIEHRLMSDELFYRMTRVPREPKQCVGDEPEAVEGPTNNNTQD